MLRRKGIPTAGSKLRYLQLVKVLIGSTVQFCTGYHENGRMKGCILASRGHVQHASA